MIQEEATFAGGASIIIVSDTIGDLAMSFSLCEGVLTFQAFFINFIDAPKNSVSQAGIIYQGVSMMAVLANFFI